jgi:hypothetical protein
MSEDQMYVERDRGILTERDRRYLLGELNGELTRNAEYQKRFQIRQRIRNAMLDFWIINRYLPGQDAGMIWKETDHWIYQSENQRKRGEAPPYPEKPFLAKCWRDWISFFVYSQITVDSFEAEKLVEWVIEEGVALGVRRKFFEKLQMYQTVDPDLDWGVGDRYRLLDFLSHIEKQVPADPEQAQSYLQSLIDQGHLQESHAVTVYQSKFE